MPPERLGALTAQGYFVLPARAIPEDRWQKALVCRLAKNAKPALDYRLAAIG